MKKVLIVEDNKENLNLIRDILKFRGYMTFEARDGETAISMAKQHRPDIILMDIQIPKIDGLTVARILKEDVETRDIKIVAVTSFAMEEEKEMILKAGLDGHIAKPIDTRELPELVEKILRKPPL